MVLPLEKPPPFNLSLQILLFVEQLDQEKEKMETTIEFPELDSIRSEAFTSRKPKRKKSYSVFSVL